MMIDSVIPAVIINSLMLAIMNDSVISAWIISAMKIDSVISAVTLHSLISITMNDSVILTVMLH